MATAKVVRLQARHDTGSELDQALSDAHAAAKAEPGTTSWEWFLAAGPGSRVIIEVFEDDRSSAIHDSSPAVARLLERFADVLETPPDVEVYRHAPEATPEEVQG